MNCFIQGSGDSKDEWRDIWSCGDKQEFWTQNSGQNKNSTAHFDVHRIANPLNGYDCVIWHHPGWPNGQDGTGLPIDRLKALCPNGVEKFGNSMCYMLAMVVLWNEDHGPDEQITTVYMPGCDYLSTPRERDQEIPGLCYWMGYLEGRGIPVHTPKRSRLSERWIYPF